MIVNHAGDANDLLTLRSCNATARQFRLIAQERLFNYVNIVINPDPGQMGRLQSLSEIFTKSPTAGHLVKQVVLGFKGGNPGAAQTCRLLLEMMPNIEQLTLESVERWGRGMCMQIPAWKVLDSGLRNAIGALLRLDTLSRLKVHGIMSFPLNILHACRKGIRAFDLTLPAPNDREEFPHNDESLFDGCEETSLTACRLIGVGRGDFNILARTMLRYPLLRLKTLELGSNDHHEGLDLPTAQKFLDSSTSSLEMFSLMTVLTNNTGSLDLSRAANLVELCLGTGGPPPVVMPWLLQVLETLPGSCRLKTLLLQFGLDDSFGDDLSRLNAELTAPGKYDACSIDLYTFSFKSDVGTALVTHMKDLVQRPNTTIYDRKVQAEVDLEAPRVRIVTDLD